MRDLALALFFLASIASAEEVTVGDVPATLLKPDGAGPFPAVVVLHDCSGRGPKASGAAGRWARELLARGYVTILPDSFRTRGYPNGICTEPPQPGRRAVRPELRARDARAALAFLRTLPFVDRERIGLMGGSHGGSTTLATIANPGSGFAAAIALYPRCAEFPQFRTSVPLLILIGELDDWTPAADCRPLAAVDHVTLKIYPGVHHSFDSPRPERYVAARINPSVPGRRGATTAGNAEAWADSIHQVTDFFGRYLRD